MNASHRRTHSRSAFTLIEVLLAVAIFSLVLAAIHGVFHSALRLRTKTVETLAASVPIQHALTIVQRDLANLVAPGGTLSGVLQSAPTLTNVSGQIGPFFYTSAGIIDDNLPWGDVEKVAYRLSDPTNNTAGRFLVRSVIRNLLPVGNDEPEDQLLLEGVDQLSFEFYDGYEWLNEWDSTTEAAVLPSAIRVRLLLASARTNAFDEEPIELLVPISVRPDTNQTATATATDTSSEGGGS